jgi:hypothetical protein
MAFQKVDQAMERALMDPLNNRGPRLSLRQSHGYDELGPLRVQNTDKYPYSFKFATYINTVGPPRTKVYPSITNKTRSFSKVSLKLPNIPYGRLLKGFKNARAHGEWTLS